MRRTAREERGAVLPVLALCVVTIALAAGFTIDLGSLASTTRRIQAVADLASLDTAAALYGQACGASYAAPGESVPSSQWDHLQAAMVASAARNGFTTATKLRLEALLVNRGPTGAITRDSSGKPTFTVLSSCSAVGNMTDTPDAVRVYVKDHVSYGFSKVVGFSGADPSRSSAALSLPLGAFAIGSSVTGLNGGVASLLDELLTTAFCSVYQAAGSVSVGGSSPGGSFGGAVGGSTTVGPLGSTCQIGLTAAGYQGLLATRVNVGAIATQLGFASPAALFASSVGVGSFFSAAANAVDCSGQGASCSTAKADLGTIGAALGGTNAAQVAVGGMFPAAASAATGSGSGGALDVSLLDLLAGSAQAVNGVNFFSIGNATTGVPGLSGTRVTVDVIEAARHYSGVRGGKKTTSQTRLTLDTTVGQTIPVSYLSGLVTVNTTATLSMHLRISATGGSAVGTLSNIRCRAPQKGIDVQVQTAAVTPTVEVSSATVTVLSVPTAVTIGVTTVPTSAAGTTLSFLAPSEYEGSATASPKHVGGANLGLSGAGISVSIAGAGSPLSGVYLGTSTAVSQDLTSLLTTIDTGVVTPLSLQLGLDIGSADVIAENVAGPSAPVKCGSQVVAG